MESNGDGTYLGGWGMSRATQRAKECENRTPDVEVMAERVKCSRLAWEGRAHGTHTEGTGSPGTRGFGGFLHDLGSKWMDFVARV